MRLFNEPDSQAQKAAALKVFSAPSKKAIPKDADFEPEGQLHPAPFGSEGKSNQINSKFKSDLSIFEFKNTHDYQNVSGNLIKHLFSSMTIEA